MRKKIGFLKKAIAKVDGYFSQSGEKLVSARLTPEEAEQFNKGGKKKAAAPKKAPAAPKKEAAVVEETKIVVEEQQQTTVFVDGNDDAVDAPPMPKGVQED